MNFVIGFVILLAGFIFMFKFLGSSPSLKKLDENNKENPTDDAIFPSNNQNNENEL